MQQAQPSSSSNGNRAVMTDGNGIVRSHTPGLLATRQTRHGSYASCTGPGSDDEEDNCDNGGLLTTVAMSYGNGSHQEHQNYLNKGTIQESQTGLPQTIVMEGPGDQGTTKVYKKTAVQQLIANKDKTIANQQEELAALKKQLEEKK